MGDAHCGGEAAGLKRVTCQCVVTDVWVAVISVEEGTGKVGQ